MRFLLYKKILASSSQMLKHIHHKITVASKQNPAAYPSDAMVSIFPAWFPDDIMAKSEIGV